MTRWDLASEAKEIVVPVHRIRLLGPWEFEWHISPEAVQPIAIRETLKLPSRWEDVIGKLASGQATDQSKLKGTAVFSRKFHCPTNLDPHEKVFVVFSYHAVSVTVSINGEPLGRADGCVAIADFEVTGRLSRFNTLAISIPLFPSSPIESTGILLADVALEIRS